MRVRHANSYEIMREHRIALEESYEHSAARSHENVAEARKSREMGKVIKVREVSP